MKEREKSKNGKKHNEHEKKSPNGLMAAQAYCTPIVAAPQSSGWIT